MHYRLRGLWKSLMYEEENAEMKAYIVHPVPAEPGI